MFFWSPYTSATLLPRVPWSCNSLEMTYQVWWSSLLKICIFIPLLFLFFYQGLSSVTTMTLSGQARVLAALRRHCCPSPIVRTPRGMIFFKIAFSKILASLEIVWSSAIILGSEQSAESLKYETVSVSLSWTASFYWRMRKSYAAKQSSRLNCFIKTWQTWPKYTNFFDSYK